MLVYNTDIKKLSGNSHNIPTNYNFKIIHIEPNIAHNEASSPIMNSLNPWTNIFNSRQRMVMASYFTCTPVT